jgi:hypothetical protein
MYNLQAQSGSRQEYKGRQQKWKSSTLFRNRLPVPPPIPLFLFLLQISHPATFALYNTPGVCHLLSSGFELKYDMLGGDEGVKVKFMEISPNLNLDNAPLLTCRPFPNVCLSNVEGASFSCLTSLSIYSDHWKSLVKFEIKKSHEMISYILA